MPRTHSIRTKRASPPKKVLSRKKGSSRSQRHYRAAIQSKDILVANSSSVYYLYKQEEEELNKVQEFLRECHVEGRKTLKIKYFESQGYQIVTVRIYTIFDLFCILKLADTVVEETEQIFKFRHPLLSEEGKRMREWTITTSPFDKAEKQLSDDLHLSVSTAYSYYTRVGHQTKEQRTEEKLFTGNVHDVRIQIDSLTKKLFQDIAELVLP